MRDPSRDRVQDLPRPLPFEMSRREWLSATLLASGTLLCGLDLLSANSPVGSMQDESFAGGKLLGTVEFYGEGKPPMDQPLGEELDGRLFTDLSKMAPNDSVIPTDWFYIRTRASQLLDLRKPWIIRLGSSNAPMIIPMEDLMRETQPQGLRLMECAGNSLSAHFGMLGVADWEGVPIASVLNRVPGAGNRVLISGFDTYATKSTTSTPGASWIFTREQLLDAGAFLATKMNGQPLTRDHGAPVRLIAPNWYGCTCIKWLNEISFTDDAAPATSQMQEYASRTHQRGMPDLARDYEPAVLDPSAMPIRIEKWSVAGRVKYRVVGIVWGGTEPVKNLMIDVNPGEKSFPVDIERAATSRSWGFWTFAWAPEKPGRHVLRMRVADAGVRTRRLDSGFYARTVEIKAV